MDLRPPATTTAASSSAPPNGTQAKSIPPQPDRTAVSVPGFSTTRTWSPMVAVIGRLMVTFGRAVAVPLGANGPVQVESSQSSQGHRAALAALGEHHVLRGTPGSHAPDTRISTASALTPTHPGQQHQPPGALGGPA